MGKLDFVSDETRKHNISVVKKYIYNWKLRIDRKGIRIIEPHARLFDSVAFSILNKAYRLSKSCILLLETGYTDEAYGMSRSILECGLNLRYLTLDRARIHSRTRNYLDFLYCEKKHFLEQYRKHSSSREQLDDIELFVKQEKIEQYWASVTPSRLRDKNQSLNDWKLIEGREWNCWKIANETHPLDSKINKDDLIIRQYATYYHASSAMVHCSVRALNNTVAESGTPYKIGENLTITYDFHLEPLIVIIEGLYLSTRYVLYGANIDETEHLDTLFIETLSQLIEERKLWND